MNDTVILLISVSTYLILAFYMYSLGMCAQNGVTLSIKKYRLFDPNVLLSIIVFALVCGLRYNVGADCESYASYFEHFVETGSNVADYDEPVFTAFTLAVAKLSGSRVLYLSLIAFVELLFLYSAFKTRRFIYPFLGLVLVLGPHFLDFNNGLRQMIVACMFVYSLQQAVDNSRIFLYVCVILFGITIHRSAVILLLAIPLVKYKGFVDYRIAISVLLMSIIISNIGIIDPLLSKADGILYLLNYDSYGDKIDYYLNMEAQIGHYGPRRLVQIASYLLIILNSEGMARFYAKDRFFKVSYLLFLVYAVFFELLASKNLLFTRPLLYFSVFWLICSAYLLYYLYYKGKTLAFWSSFLACCSYSVLSTLAEYDQPSSSNVFRFLFMQQL